MTASPAMTSADVAPEISPETGSMPPVGETPDAASGQARPRKSRLLVLLVLLLAFGALMGVAVWYLLFRQPINPIPAIPGAVVMPAYATSVYGVDRPLGVAVSADGTRIYAGETGGEFTARVFDGNGNAIGAMRPPLSTGTSHVPVYLAVDPVSSEVYVSDRSAAVIYIYDAQGTYQRTYAPPEELAGWQPLGLAFDTAGNLYVTDVSTTPQTVIMLDRQGAVVRTFGDAAGMSFPNGIAVDKDGNLYVADSNNGRLLVFDPAGTQVTQVGRGVGEGNLGLPRGVAVSADGRVYIGDSTGQNVVVYGTYKPGEARLEFFGTFGTGGVVDGAFQYPNGLALDSRGRVYVADSGNDRVQVWSY